MQAIREMEGSKSRRKPVTYGKKSTNRQLPTYDFDFHDLDEGSDTIQVGTTDASVPPKSQGRPLQKKPHGLDTSRLTSQELRQGGKHLWSPASPVSSIQDKRDHAQHGSTNSSLFDFPSSDEDVNRQLDTGPYTKRRKLTPVSDGAKQRRGTKVNAEVVSLARLPEPAKLSSGSIAATSGLSSAIHLSAKTKPRQASPRMAARRKRTPSLGQEDAVMAITNLEDDGRAVNVMSLTRSPTPPRTPAANSPSVQYESSSPSAQLIDQLNRSIPLGSQMSKRRNTLSDLSFRQIGVASPGQLAMRSLRLTPEESILVETGQGESTASTSNGPLTPSRSRRRLVDALDSPRKHSTARKTTADSSTSSTEGSMNHDDDHSVLAFPNSQGNSQADDHRIRFEDNAVPAMPNVGSKVTYARQRSHLSDMVVDDMMEFTVPSITHLADSMATAQAPTRHKSRPQNSQEGLDGDEDQAASGITSIHELRQAGVNRRLQEELDALVEDIEALGRSSKSRRLRGLMQLSQKLLDPGVAQRVVDNGMHQRIATAHAPDETDLLGALLTSCTLSILWTSSQPSLKNLQQIFEAMMGFSLLLMRKTKEWSSFVRGIAKDRKQNLSGAMIKDVIDFQQIIQSSQIWTQQKPLELTPQLIALRSAELLVRGIRELKDLETSPPQLFFGELIAIGKELAQEESNQLLGPCSPYILESTVSILEASVLSERALDDEYNEAVEQLPSLGPLLIKAKVLPRQRQIFIEQQILKMITTVTNNNSRLCETFGMTELIPAIFDVVRDDFMGLAACADIGKKLDAPKLDTVILALGSLINFAECAHSSRIAMNSPTAGSDSMVQWLVLAFNSRAGKGSDASTLEQTHALIAFGYLSMLICALCLDDGIRHSVRTGMRSKSLHPLVVTVEEFLNHFRTLEQAMIEEEASNNFTERFDGILRALREAEGLP